MNRDVVPLFSFSTRKSACTGRRGASLSTAVALRSTPDKPPAMGAGSWGILGISSSVKRNEMLFTAHLTHSYLFHTPTLRTRSKVTLRTQQPHAKTFLLKCQQPENQQDAFRHILSQIQKEKWRKQRSRSNEHFYLPIFLHVIPS